MENKKNLKILALLASPRKLGNCEILAKELCRHVPQDHTLKLLRLPEKNILSCKACYACLESGDCPQKDDFSQVAQELVAADGVIIASPTYFMGPNGVLKVFLDRCLQMFGHSQSLRGKPAINIITAGLEGEAGYTEAALNSFTLILGMNLQGSAVFYGALPGESLWQKPEQQERVKALGNVFFNDAPPVNDPWRCPLCGSDTVQLLGGNRVQCQVCRNFGTLSAGEHGLVLETSLKPENIFFTAEQAAHHLQWLQGMKKRFLQIRRQLADFQRDYADDGEWV
ncbi:MAG: hypothetical protein DRH04_05810 [Deltaproteobacteria bacterium]|nr:MAG: hypothetical protein DRH04_05810 [Deltaproteobacteria bacterium]